jgi:hypothetical protein
MIAQLLKKISAFDESQEIYHYIHNSPLVDPILSNVAPFGIHME